MNIQAFKEGGIGLLAIALVLAIGGAAYSQQTSEWGQPTGRIVSPQTGQFYYTVSVPLEGGLWMYDTTLVLNIDSFNLETATMSFTAYNHMGTPRRPFWTRTYLGNIAWAPDGTGVLTYTDRFIADRSYPIPNPNSLPVQFVPL